MHAKLQVNWNVVALQKQVLFEAISTVFISSNLLCLWEACKYFQIETPVKSWFCVLFRRRRYRPTNKKFLGFQGSHREWSVRYYYYYCVPNSEFNDNFDPPNYVRIAGHILYWLYIFYIVIHEKNYPWNHAGKADSYYCTMLLISQQLSRWYRLNFCL